MPNRPAQSPPRPRKRPRLLTAAPAKPAKPAKPDKAAILAEMVSLAAPRCKLSRGMITRFCKLAKRGLPASTICNYLGISPGSFHAWVAKGESFARSAEAGSPILKLALYGLFVKQYKRAAAHYLKFCQKNWESDEPKSYYRWVKMLERRDRRNFGVQEQPGGEADALQPDERFI